MGTRFSAPVQTGSGPNPASCTMNTGSFPGVKSGRGVTLTPHLLLVPLVMKQQSYTSTLPMGRTACTEPQCLYKGCTLLSLLVENLSPLGYYTASSGNSLTTFRTNSRFIYWTLGYTETSVRNYHYSPCNMSSTSRRKPKITQRLLKPNKLH